MMRIFGPGGAACKQVSRLFHAHPACRSKATPKAPSIFESPTEGVNIPITDDRNKHVVKVVGEKIPCYYFPSTTAVVQKLFNIRGEGVQELQEGELGQVHLSKTTFLSKSPTQDGHSGRLIGTSKATKFRVESCVRVHNNRQAIAHLGQMMTGKLSVDQEVRVVPGHWQRARLAQNLTCAHLFHDGLMALLPAALLKDYFVTDFGFRLSIAPNGATIDDELVHRLQEYVRSAIRLASPIESEEVSEENMPYSLSELAPIPEAEHSEPMTTVVRTPNSRPRLCNGSHVVNTSHVSPVVVVNVEEQGDVVNTFVCLTGYRAAQQVKSDLRSLKLAQELVTFSEKRMDSYKMLDRMWNAKIQNFEKILHKASYCVRQKLRRLLEDLDNEVKGIISQGKSRAAGRAKSKQLVKDS